MPTGAVKPSAADYSQEPRVERHRYRGRTFTFTELPIGKYDELVAQATIKDDTTGVERTDDFALMKLLVLNVVDVSPREYAKLGTRVILTLNGIVRKMHYGEEPEELLKDEADDKADDEGDSKGNG